MNVFRSLILLLMLHLPLMANAADTPPVRLVNAYFANDAVEVDGWLQPVRVITSMQGNHPGATSLFVLNLIMQPGEHELVAPVYGPDGREFTRLNFKVNKIDKENSPQAMWGILKNRVPTGGITLKVMHRMKGSQKSNLLGEFYLHTY